MNAIHHFHEFFVSNIQANPHGWHATRLEAHDDRDPHPHPARTSRI
jgi:hypothetical protein